MANANRPGSKLSGLEVRAIRDVKLRREVEVHLGDSGLDEHVARCEVLGAHARRHTLGSVDHVTASRSVAAHPMITGKP